MPRITKAQRWLTRRRAEMITIKTLAIAATLIAMLAPASAHDEFNVGDLIVYRGPLPQIACSLIGDTYDGWYNTLRAGAGIPLSDSRSFISVRTMAHKNWVDAVNSLHQQRRFCALTERDVKYVVVAKKYSQGTDGPPTDTPAPKYSSASSSTYLCLKPKAAEGNTCLWVEKAY